MPTHEFKINLWDFVGKEKIGSIFEESLKKFGSSMVPTEVTYRIWDANEDGAITIKADFTEARKF